ncbi:DUF1642 domain-containing protein [Streptococcus peroris]|uniref:DUF1642 domain-containing protein n=1 Tax=Streptococcus peroris TaxID=68891 RepID=UPI0039C3FA16
MNKKELIDKIESLPSLTSITSIRPYVDKKIVLGLISQLDEPEKVEIPQFVADWYEKHKDDLEYDIWEYILHWGKQQKSEFYEWMNHANNKPFQTLANMHQFGYEVEEEPKYQVSMKGIDTNFNFLNRHRNENYWIFSSKDKNTLYQTCHTRKELEDAGFGWVFSCEGIEIEEVEE